MSLLTVPIVKNSHVLAGIYLILLKKRRTYTKLESFAIQKLDLIEKTEEVVIM